MLGGPGEWALAGGRSECAHQGQRPGAALSPAASGLEREWPWGLGGLFPGPCQGHARRARCWDHVLLSRTAAHDPLCFQDPRTARGTRAPLWTRASGRPLEVMTPPRPTDPRAATAGRAPTPRPRSGVQTAGMCGARALRPTARAVTIATWGRPGGRAGPRLPGSRRPLPRSWMRAGTTRTGRQAPGPQRPSLTWPHCTSFHLTQEIPAAV